MEDCVFCKIVGGQIPARKVYEDDHVLAFDDIHPMAPVHVVVVPKRHISTLMDVTPDMAGTLERLVHGVQEAARAKGIDRRGFRTVVNCNDEGGQVVFHLHLHVLGGQRLKDDLA
jgi:histidine triad (HIT) family protein